MTAILEQLHHDHINYSRLLNLLDAQCQTLTKGDKSNHLIVSDIMKYMMNYPDVFHHPAEELLLDLLTGLASEDVKTVKQIRDEHELLAELGQNLQSEVQNVAGEHIVSKDKILSLASDYLKTLRNHMMIEEREIFPLFESNLEQPDWERAEQRLKEAVDPIFEKPQRDEYRRLFDSIVEYGPDDSLA